MRTRLGTSKQKKTSTAEVGDLLLRAGKLLRQRMGEMAGVQSGNRVHQCRHAVVDGWIAIVGAEDLVTEALARRGETIREWTCCP